MIIVGEDYRIKIKNTYTDLYVRGEVIYTTVARNGKYTERELLKLENETEARQVLRTLIAALKRGEKYYYLE